MRISDNGLDLIKQFEGFRSAPYLDPVGIYTKRPLASLAAAARF